MTMRPGLLDPLDQLDHPAVRPAQLAQQELPAHREGRQARLAQQVPQEQVVMQVQLGRQGQEGCREYRE